MLWFMIQGYVIFVIGLDRIDIVPLRGVLITKFCLLEVVNYKCENVLFIS